MNSETDFVARNTDFQTFTQRVTQGALSSLPTVDTSIITSTTTVNQQAETVYTNTLTNNLLPGGDILTNKECTIKDGIIGLTAKVGENIILRRCVKYTLPNNYIGGIITSYIHNSINANSGAIGVIVALAPVTKSSTPLTKSHSAYPAIQDLGKKIAMHIAAAKPIYLNKDVIPNEELNREKALAKETMQNQIQNKPEHIVNKILDGKLNKWYSEICLQDQIYTLSDDNIKINKYVENISKAANYPVQVIGFISFRVGETAPPATN